MQHHDRGARLRPGQRSKTCRSVLLTPKQYITRPWPPASDCTPSHASSFHCGRYRDGSDVGKDGSIPNDRSDTQQVAARYAMLARYSRPLTIKKIQPDKHWMPTKSRENGDQIVMRLPLFGAGGKSRISSAYSPIPHRTPNRRFGVGKSPRVKPAPILGPMDLEPPRCCIEAGTGLSQTLSSKGVVVATSACCRRVVPNGLCRHRRYDARYLVRSRFLTGPTSVGRPLTRRTPSAVVHAEHSLTAHRH